MLRVQCLSDVILPVETWNPASERRIGTFPYIDLSAVDNEQKVVTAPRNLAFSDAPSRARQLVEKDDVLVSTVRPNLNGVALLKSVHHGATASTGFCVLRANRDRVDPHYLFQWVKSPSFVADMVQKATGASYPAVSDKIICSSIIPLPALGEQRRIAAVLDQADDLRRKRREAIQRLSKAAQTIFVDMFGDWSHPQFGGKLLELGDHLDFLTSGSRSWAEYYRDLGSLFLRIQNVKADELDLSDVAFVEPPTTAEATRTRVEAGDVLLSITADLGRTAVVPDGLGNAFINQHLALLRTHAFEPRYLSAALASPAGQIAI